MKSELMASINNGGIRERNLPPHLKPSGPGSGCFPETDGRDGCRIRRAQAIAIKRPGEDHE